MYKHTRANRDALSPDDAISFLKEGNNRFCENLRRNRNLLQQVNDTSDGQWPFAAILSCIDSRTSAELIFDQGLGDIFSVRIAGNFVNDDILGSLEFACKVAGSKIAVVLGHSGCGAVKGACDHVELGHLTGMLKKIQPAVDAIKEPKAADQRTSANAAFVEEVAVENVRQTVAAITARSEVLRSMAKAKEIRVVGAMYSVADGTVTFLDDAVA